MLKQIPQDHHIHVFENNFIPMFPNRLNDD